MHGVWDAGDREVSGVHGIRGAEQEGLGCRVRGCGLPRTGPGLAREGVRSPQGAGEELRSTAPSLLPSWE